MKIKRFFLLFILFVIASQLSSEKTFGHEITKQIMHSFEKNDLVAFSKLLNKNEPIQMTTGFKDEEFSFKNLEIEFPRSKLSKEIFDINYKKPYMIDEMLFSFRKAYLSNANKLDEYFPKNERAQLKVRYNKIDYVIYINCYQTKNCLIVGFFREFGGD